VRCAILILVSDYALFMRPDLCPACNYDLSGSAQGRGSVCPECGGPIDWTALNRWRDRVYRRKSILLGLALLAPIAPAVLALLRLKQTWPIDAAFVLAAPLSIAFLMASFRLDAKERGEVRSRWRDFGSAVWLVGLYCLCLWPMLVLIAVLTGLL
jgi:hypothetical protein